MASVVIGVVMADKQRAVVRVGIFVETARLGVAPRLLHQFLFVEIEWRAAAWGEWLVFLDGTDYFIHFCESTSSSFG
jgi:hypothetical protein